MCWTFTSTATIKILYLACASAGILGVLAHEPPYRRLVDWVVAVAAAAAVGEAFLILSPQFALSWVVAAPKAWAAHCAGAVGEPHAVAVGEAVGEPHAVAVEDVVGEPHAVAVGVDVVAVAVGVDIVAFHPGGRVGGGADGVAAESPLAVALSVVVCAVLDPMRFWLYRPKHTQSLNVSFGSRGTEGSRTRT